MGLYHNVTTGVGFRIPAIMETEITKVNACPKSCGGKHLNFCSNCGSEVEEIEIPIESYISIEDVTGNDNLCYYFWEDKYIVLSNIMLCGSDIRENEFFVVDGNLIDKTKESFIKEHKDDIEKIEKHIGEKIKLEYIIYHDFS